MHGYSDLPDILLAVVNESIVGSRIAQIIEPTVTCTCMCSM